MTIPDPQAVTAIIRDVAEMEILPRFRKLQPEDVRSKSSPFDLVTTADLESERALGVRLRELLPGSNILGEEAASADSSIFNFLKGQSPVWILDPVDGTHNFTQGKSNFVVIVALAVAGKTVGGWIYRPLDRTTVWALAGRGAWYEDRRLKIESDFSPGGLRAAVNRQLSRQLERIGNRGERSVPRPGHRLFCAGCEYRDLALGNLHVCQFDRLKPWDHAAGVLIHREAGGTDGYCSSGTPYEVDGPREGCLLLAPTPDIWKDLQDLLALN